MLKKCLFFLIITIGCFAHEYEIGICAIFRNEGRFLKEWIEYHRLIGVEHFYLYNHMSQDNYKEILAPYVKEGIVEVFDCNIEVKTRPEWLRLQISAYHKGIKRALGKCKWLAIVDLDELIFPKLEETLPELLKDYDAYDALCVNWQLFGTSHIQRLDPKKLMIEQFILRGPSDFYQNRFVKTILKPESAVLGMSIGWNVHLPKLKKGCIAVNPEFEKVTKIYPPSIVVDRVCINHYATRDEEHFHQKKLKQVNNTTKARQKMLLDLEQCNEIEDTEILRYAEELREAVFNTSASAL